MKKLAVLFVCAVATVAWSQTYVAPHVRRDGTTVEGHFRSAPNRTVDDNYGTRGNQNPFTGQSGHEPRSYERPYQAPSYSPPPQPSYGQQCGHTSTGRYVCR
jgi:hypothetical protein